MSANRLGQWIVEMRQSMKSEEAAINRLVVELRDTERENDALRAGQLASSVEYDTAKKMKLLVKMVEKDVLAEIQRWLDIHPRRSP